MANWREEVLLEGEFRVSSKKRVLFKVTLTPVGLYYSPITSSNQYEEKLVRMSDIVGCQCTESSSTPSKLQSDSIVAAFTVFAYPFRKKVFTGKRIRHRQVTTFEISTCKSFEENWKICRKWRSVICSLARDIPVRPEDVDTCTPPPRGRLLVFVNPSSGSGRALQTFKNEVVNMLEEANIPFKLVVTEYAGHAQDMVQNLELSDWGGLVIVSGDGLIFEVINGLMKRVDWSSAIKTPVGCVPGGSGNALACSINYSAGEPVDVDAALHSTFILVKHRVLPMDLVLIQTPTHQYFSFLSVTWGIVADIDFESEKYRNLGEARFTFGAIKRIANLRSYQGRLSFLPVAQYTPKTPTKPRTLVKLRRFSSAQFWYVSSAKQDPQSNADTSVPENNNASEQENGELDFNVTANNAAVCQGDEEKEEWISTSMGAADSNSLKAPDSTHFQNLEGQQQLAHQSEPEGSFPKEMSEGFSEVQEADIEEETFYAKKKAGQAVPATLLPPLVEPVPENWVVVEDKFVLACALYQTHLGSEMLGAPAAHMADGVIHLMFVREGITRNQLFSLFLTFSEGGHVDSPYVEFVPVLAFRLEPYETSGNIMIDGERLDPMPLQGQVLPSIARIMGIK
ncbi:LOW QUALITY PROTEIN: sphingosine kinase 1-like [Pomacea canaliculata]|uniref:LOW QUALITY PROTEIN: sphingosine kinase 1-like n=1 Tax=Pomacea canaliculata TaxID=400727 RepID=UPI000D72D087|nr:LOW QUALITY PROTEIN: sphingosine kinase 1-like [Pomacea canaliculata]